MIQKKFIKIIEEGDATHIRQYCNLCGRPIFRSSINCSSCEELLSELNKKN